MNFMNKPIEMRIPQQLLRHPKLLELPNPPVTLQETEALKKDLRSRGFLDPIKITEAGYVVDGWHRRNAAIDLYQEVPCVIVDDHEVVEIAMAGLLLRRHLTKSARAYIAVPMMAMTKEERLAKIRQNLSQVVDTAQSALSAHRGNGLSLEDIATSIDVGRRYVYMAEEVHKLLAVHSEFRPMVEKSLFCEGAGLGGIKAGLESRIDAKKRGEHGGKRREQLEFDFAPLENATETWCRRWSQPEIFQGPHKEQAFQTLETHIRKMPDEVIDALGSVVRAVRRSRKEGGVS